MNQMKTLSFAVTAVGLLVIATPAFSKSQPILVTAPSEVVTRHVSYADLNLASAAGEKTLYRRVGTAVSEVCLEAVGGNNGGFEFNLSMLRCNGSAWDGARPQIARAVQRGHEIAATGSSSIAAAAITITIPE